MIAVNDLKRQGAIPTNWKAGTNPYNYNLTPAASVTNVQWKSLPLVLQVLYAYTPVDGIHALRS